jgi:hypothetical protein
VIEQQGPPELERAQERKGWSAELRRAFWRALPPATRARVGWWLEPTDVGRWLTLFRFYVRSYRGSHPRPSLREVWRGWSDLVTCPYCPIAFSNTLELDGCDLLRGWAMVLAMNGARPRHPRGAGWCTS